MVKRQSYPKISVIIPVYNTEKYLRECLDSVVKQTLKDIEIILIDDGSTDGSFSICQEYVQKDDRIQLIRQKNKGAGFSRNYGVKIATGEYIYFLDSDDWLELDTLEYCYQKAHLASLDVLFFNAWGFFDLSPKSEFPYHGKDFAKKFPRKSVFRFQNTDAWLTSTLWHCISKREVIIKNKIHCDESVKNCEDMLFILPLSFVAQRISFVDRYFIHHRVAREGSLGKTREKSWKSSVIACRNLKKWLVQKDLYDKLYSVFLRYALNTIMGYGISNLSFPIFNFAVANCIEKVIPEFGFKERDANFFSNNYTYQKMKKLENKKMPSLKLERLFYSDRNKIIPIVFAGNEEYIAYAGVAIQSIKEYANSDLFYDIYFLYTKLSESGIQCLEKLSSENILITCIDVSKKLPVQKLFISGHITKETYYRFLIPNLFYGYEKIIYLDCDVILQNDVAKLLDYDLDDMFVAGVKDVGSDETYVRSLGLDPESYINAGILVFNIAEWNKYNLSEEAWKVAVNWPFSSFLTHDQDVLNYICKDKILLISPEWNILIQNYQKDYIYTQKIKKISVIHFNSPKKPWKSLCPLYDRWWFYARKSSFYENIITGCINNKQKNIYLFEEDKYSLPDKEKILVSGFFDKDYYEKKYRLRDIDLLDHYLISGWKLGYNPSLQFNTNHYLQINTDIRREEVNPLWHYVMYGQKEKRSLCRSEVTNTVTESFMKEFLSVRSKSHSKFWFLPSLIHFCGRKKVLLITHELSCTGAPFSVLSMAEVLKKNNYRIIVLSLKNGPLKKKFEKLGRVFITEKMETHYAFMTMANVVIVSTYMLYRYYLLSSKIRPTMWWISEPGINADYNTRWAIQNAQEIYVRSEYSAKQFLEYNKNINIIKHGIPDLYHENYIKIRPLIFACIGTIEHRKGQDIFIQAVLKICPELRKKARFYILGKLWGDRSFGEKLMKYNHDEIIFYPEIRDKDILHHFYEEISCLVVPSRSEPTSRVAIEAMMMGRPVIMSDCVGAQYLLNGKNGFTFPSENSDALASIIENIIRYPEQLYPMEKEARNAYLQNNSMILFEQNIMNAICNIQKNFEESHDK